MNQLIDTHGKAIITGLLLVIAVLAIMLLGSCSSVTTRGSKEVSDKNLAAFLDTLFDPKEKVHGVLLIRTEGHDRTRLLTRRLEETEPCFWDPKSILTAEQTPVLLPRECVKEGQAVNYVAQQVFTVTPGTNEVGGSMVWVADLDHRVVCTQPDGDC